MRISDWSSDVCSSDLSLAPRRIKRRQHRRRSERAGQPLPDPRAEQPFVEKAIAGNARQPPLPQVKAAERDARAAKGHQVAQVRHVRKYRTVLHELVVERNTSEKSDSSHK